MFRNEKCFGPYGPYTSMKIEAIQRRFCLLCSCNARSIHEIIVHSWEGDLTARAFIHHIAIPGLSPGGAFRFSQSVVGTRLPRVLFHNIFELYEALTTQQTTVNKYFSMGFKFTIFWALFSYSIPDIPHLPRQLILTTLSCPRGYQFLVDLDSRVKKTRDH